MKEQDARAGQAAACSLRDDDLGAGRPKVARIVHLGLGAFHRAHQAWYTATVDDEKEWGITAFTGRSPDAAMVLTRQDCLYSVTERNPEGDNTTLVGSIIEARDGAETDALYSRLAAVETAVVTLTITELGYRLDLAGRPDLTDSTMVEDLRRLTAWCGDELPTVSSVLARLVVGLALRREKAGGSLAVVPCDNVPGNGRYVCRGVLTLAEAMDPGLASWVRRHVSFVSTSVDRITPRTTEADLGQVAHVLGRFDAAAVITEPFTDWVLSGGFPAGRPAWERAGAKFVEDIEPYERRKLWLLNGAHSLLAATGPLRGHTSVAQAVGDPVCLELVEDFWSDAVRHLPTSVETVAYRRDLLDRFRNPRIEHRLAQISEGSARKFSARIVPVSEAERAAGRPAEASARAIAGWVSVQVGQSRDLLATISPALAEDTEFVGRVDRYARAHRETAYERDHTS